MNIFATVARVFCPPAGVAMKLVGGLVSSQCTIAAASCSRIAETAVADAFKTDYRQETAEEGRDEILESLRNAVEAETRMLNRISSLADSEQTRVVLR